MGWIPDSKDWIPDSKAQDSGFQRQKNVGFRIPDSLTRGETTTTTTLFTCQIDLAPCKDGVLIRDTLIIK